VHVDFLIIGQGVCGTLLSWNLRNLGSSFLVIDTALPANSSRVASAHINPVTGKRHVKSWMYDTLLPAALKSYHSMEAEFGNLLITQCSLLQFHTSRQEEETFVERASLLPGHLQLAQEVEVHQWFQSYRGVGTIAPCWLVQGNTLLNCWRATLSQQDQLLEETFDIADLQVNREKVIYKGITASKIIFCDGPATSSNPYFSLLPFSFNKGEAIIASIPGLPNDHIYKYDLKIVPWQDDLFWIGSSFEWKYDNLEPTTRFREKVDLVLKSWLKLPYSIVDHLAAERPSSVDYRPFVGVHPIYSSICILNGMGTKGYSQAPYFAKQLAALLVHDTPVLPDVDVQRYKKVLARPAKDQGAT
jgi:glycine/D-amino acid oxidase-like deaminating enzyme